MTADILTVIGAFIALGLSVNAFFIKQLVDSINQVKIQTAILIERNNYTETRLEKFEKNITNIYSRLNKEL